MESSKKDFDNYIVKTLIRPCIRVFSQSEEQRYRRLGMKMGNGIKKVNSQHSSITYLLWPGLLALAGVLLIMLGVARADAPVFGPDRGDCLSNCDDCVVISETNRLKDKIEAIGRGKTLLLRGGAYTMSGDTTIPAGSSATNRTRISALANRDGSCQEVTVTMDKQGTLKFSNYVEVRGITWDMPSSLNPYCTRYTSGGGKSNDCRKFVSMEVDNDRDVRILNNKFKNAGYALRVYPGSKDVLFKGNLLKGTWSIALAIREGNQNNNMENVTIEENYFGPSKDDVIQAENHKNLLIKNNYFEKGQLYQYLDIKAGGGDTTIEGNYLDCRDARTGCILFHSDDYLMSAHVKNVFKHNRVYGCGAEKWLTMGGNKDHPYRNLEVSYNYFIDEQNRRCRTILGMCKDCAFLHNSMLNGEFQIQSAATNAVVKDNIFFKTTIKGDSPKICSYNIFYDMKNLSNCSKTMSDNPQFAVTAPGVLSITCPGSPACKSASNNENRGAFQGNGSDGRRISAPMNLSVVRIQ